MKMKCPVCSATRFYVKNPDDAYETYAFEIVDGKIVFDEEISEADRPEIDEDTEIYCDTCAWHGKLKELK